MCFLLLESLSENYEIVERVKILEKYGENMYFIWLELLRENYGMLSVRTFFMNNMEKIQARKF